MSGGDIAQLVVIAFLAVAVLIQYFTIRVLQRSINMLADWVRRISRRL